MLKKSEDELLSELKRATEAFIRSMEVEAQLPRTTAGHSMSVLFSEIKVEQAFMACIQAGISEDKINKVF